VIIAAPRLGVAVSYFVHILYIGRNGSAIGKVEIMADMNFL
jgi:hypothetical protein